MQQGCPYLVSLRFQRPCMPCRAINNADLRIIRREMINERWLGPLKKRVCSLLRNILPFFFFVGLLRDFVWKYIFVINNDLLNSLILCCELV